MKRILVSGASGIVGYGVLRSLRQSGDECFLVGTTVHTDSVAPAFCDVCEHAPHTASAEYLDWLLDTLRRHHIDMLIPGIEIDMYHWADHVPQIQSTGAFPLLNDLALVALCQDKWNFFQRLQQEGLSCAIESSLEPDYDFLVSTYGLPFLLKPRRGFGSKGVVRVSSEAQFLAHRSEVGTQLMAQPIVGSDHEEFTTSAFCDGVGGYFAMMSLRRTLSSEGFTDKAEVTDSAEFAPVVAELCQLLRPLGPTNFQFRRCAEGPKLLEINPRVSSSTSIRSAFGYNESRMAVDYFLYQRSLVQPAIRRGRAVRYTDERIFYDDGIYL